VLGYPRHGTHSSAARPQRLKRNTHTPSHQAAKLEFGGVGLGPGYDPKCILEDTATRQCLILKGDKPPVWEGPDLQATQVCEGVVCWCWGVGGCVVGPSHRLLCSSTRLVEPKHQQFFKNVKDATITCLTVHARVTGQVPACGGSAGAGGGQAGQEALDGGRGVPYQPGAAVHCRQDP
jgi:hypothetical protein